MFPTVLYLFYIRHIRHRAARSKVRQHDFLVRLAQDVRTLGHEVNTAENDVFRILALRRLLCKFEGIPPIISELDDLISLVVVPEDDNARAERFLGSGDPAVYFLGALM